MVNTPINKYRYPWREGNRFDLLVDGENFFPAMLGAISAAERYVLMEFYLFESGQTAGRFIDALCAAVRRGVQAHLLLDDFGARGLGHHDRQRLLAGGVHLEFYNPLRYGKLRRNLLRDHRKLLVVDGAVAFTGGAGITDEFADGGRRGKPWHDVMVAVRGPCVADWQDLFLRNWNGWRKPEALELPAPEAEPWPDGAPGRVTLNAPTRMEIKRSVLKRLRSAERETWLATAYFIPSWKIRRALKASQRQGSDVRLLLPGPETDHPAVRHAGRRYYARLLKNRVRIFEYLPRFLHAKVLLCDNWAAIGSSNIDRWNLRWNLEAAQEVDDQAFAAQVQALFEQDFSQSEEFHYKQWHRRPWPLRLLEWFWGRIDILQERLLEHRRRR